MSKSREKNRDPKSKGAESSMEDETVSPPGETLEETEDIIIENGGQLPLVPLRNEVVYPQMVVPVGAVRSPSIRALDEARREVMPLVLVTQRDMTVEEPDPEDLYTVGTLARVVQLLELPDGSVRAIVEGITRVRLEQVHRKRRYYTAEVAPFVEMSEETREIKALMRTMVRHFEEISRLSDRVPPEALVTVMNVHEPGRLADLVAASLTLTVEDKQELLETAHTSTRLRLVEQHLVEELELLRLEQKIHSEVRGKLSDSQRQYFLREKMQAIRMELGETETEERETAEYHDRIMKAAMSDEATEKALGELSRLERMHPSSPEVGIIRTFLDWLIGLPWQHGTEDRIDLETAARILDRDHHGLKKVKERILEFLAVRKLVEQVRGPILAFTGPPGVGKTSIGRSIAQCMGREFIRVSLGGVRDEAEIRGHRRTYVGALPGKIIQALRRAGSRNPVFMIDEIDKLGADFRGDPTSALLEVLDPEQNDSFRDHYLEVAFDLSEVMFIATGNDLGAVPPALRDRMEVIEFAGYIEEEKLAIAKKYLVPRQRKNHGLTGKHLTIYSDALRHIIRHYTHEAGVRNLDREVAAVCRKTAREVASGATEAVKLKTDGVEALLGPPRYRLGSRQAEDRIGVCTGLAFTGLGGDVLTIEVSIVDGDGELLLTGHLGEVMRESAQAALSYARSEASRHGIAHDFFAKHDIHVHVPAGAVPKEGPSAGVAIAIALLSALLQRPCRSDTAMTGEVTLHGRVMAVGGVREKVLAAHRGGVKRVLLPVENRKDVSGPDDLPDSVRNELEIVFIEDMSDAVREAFGE